MKIRLTPLRDSDPFRPQLTKLVNPSLAMWILPYNLGGTKAGFDADPKRLLMKRLAFFDTSFACVKTSVTALTQVFHKQINKRVKKEYLKCLRNRTLSLRSRPSQ